MSYFLMFLTLLGGTWIAYGYYSVKTIEEPAFQLIIEEGSFTIRDYKPFMIAKAKVKGRYDQAASLGFRLIADFIFGNNQEQTKISMTAPVIQRQSNLMSLQATSSEKRDEAEYEIAFVMPSQYTLATLPKPRNPSVMIEEVQPRRMAVVRFSGVFSEQVAYQKRDLLKAWLKTKGFSTLGIERVARYNPPGTPPFMNRHEVWIELK